MHRGNLPPRPVSIPTTLDDSGSGFTVNQYLPCQDGHHMYS